MTTNLAFSATRLMTYEDCPFMFYKKEIEKADTEQTLPLALGSATHLALELILKGVLRNEAILKGFTEYQIDGLSIIDISNFVDNAPYQQFMGAAITVENQFRLPLDDAGEYEITGVIDVADNKGHFLADWKTNRKVYTPTDTKQLALYAWALHKLKGQTQVLATLYFLRFYKQQKQSHLFQMWEMENARLWALKLTREINQKNNLVNMFTGVHKDNAVKIQFSAKPSNRCTHCSFAVECHRKFSAY